MTSNQNFENTADDYMRSNKVDASKQPSSVLPAEEMPNQMASVALIGSEIFEENIIDLKSLNLEGAEELFKRPSYGRPYSVDIADEEIIKERLHYISVSKSPPEDSIDEALDMADAAFLLRLMGKSNHKIELAEQKAKRGAHLMQLATVLLENGEELLRKSKDIIQMRYEGNNKVDDFQVVHLMNYNF